MTLCPCCSFLFFFFFNDTATTEIYTLSLHDALPILPIIMCDSTWQCICHSPRASAGDGLPARMKLPDFSSMVKTNERSEEHTSELQSQSNLVCRLLLEKKKKKKNEHTRT